MHFGPNIYHHGIRMPRCQVRLHRATVSTANSLHGRNVRYRPTASNNSNTG